MPTPTYDLIASNVLTSSASSVTFSSIPATYRDLVLVVQVTSATTLAYAVLEFNADSGNNYSAVQMRGTGTAAQSGTDTNIAFIDLRLEVSSSNRGLAIAQIMDYSATDKHKTVLVRANTPASSVEAAAGRWASTSAINSLKVSAVSTNTFASGSTFYLYGIA